MKITIGDPAANDEACLEYGYEGTRVSNTRITVKDASNTILGTGTVSGDGSFISGGCYWSVTLPGMDRNSTAYVFEVVGSHIDDAITVSRQELEEVDWNPTLRYNF